MKGDAAARQNRFDRVALLARTAVDQKVGVLVLLEGANLPGIKRVAGRLARILDPRHFRVERLAEKWTGAHALLHPYWNTLPRFGEVVIHEHAYYHELSAQDPRRRVRERAAEDIVGFEETLSADGYAIIKVFFDRDRRSLKQDVQDLKRHVRQLIRGRLNRITARYADYTDNMISLIRATDRPNARWLHAPAAGSPREVEESVLEHLIAVLETRLQTDSRAAVAAFDQAMQERREKRRATDGPT